MFNVVLNSDRLKKQFHVDRNIVMVRRIIFFMSFFFILMAI